MNRVELDSESFRNYLNLHPFDRLNKRIAAVNQAEIYPTSLQPFLRVFEKFGFTTLGDIDRFIAANSDDAYQMALSQIALTDLDILSENVGLLNLCVVHAVKTDGIRSLYRMYKALYGASPQTEEMAQFTYEAGLSALFHEEIILPIEFSVVGALDGIYLFIKLGHFVGFEAIFEGEGYLTFVKGVPFCQDHQQFQRLTHDGMRNRNTDTVLDLRQ